MPALRIEPNGSLPVTGEEVHSDGYQLVFVIDNATVASGTAVLALTLADGSVVTLKKTLSDVVNAAKRTTAGPTMTFQGKWSQVVAGCNGDPACNVLTGPTYCNAGKVRGSMQLEQGMQLPAGASAKIDAGETVDLSQACVEQFRQSTTEITGNCYVVQLSVNGQSALYIQSAAQSPLAYKQFDDYFSAHQQCQ